MAIKGLLVVALGLLASADYGNAKTRGADDARKLQTEGVEAVQPVTNEGGAVEGGGYYDQYKSSSSMNTDSGTYSGVSSSSMGSTPTGPSGYSTNTHGSTSGSNDYDYGRGGGKPPCACRRYLQTEYLWYKVEEILVFPDFCCFLSVLAYYVNYEKGQGGRLTEQLSEQEALDKFLGSVVEMSAASRNKTESSIIEEIDRSFSSEVPEYGYDNKNDFGECYGLNGVYLLKCLLKQKLHEGIDACYCEYRGNLGCSYTENCGKDIYYDLKYASRHDPFFVCFQCPAHENYHDDYNLPNYLYGAPYEPCIGLCFLTGSYHEQC